MKHLFAAASTLPFVMGGLAYAQTDVQEVVVTGTRTSGFKAVDSPAPIEVVGSDALKRTGFTDLAQALSTSVPSLNIQTNGGDAAALNIQAALRGLSPNDTLVLVDGKRRHTTANLAVDGGSPYSGAATTDLSFIPIAAIDHIEVLTDGAAAQYGTDAIAGVVNIILKKSDHAGSISATGGQYFGGEGKTGEWSFNKGFAIGDKGFFNLTLEEHYHGNSVLGCGDARFQNASCQLLPGLTYPNSNVTQASNFPHENQLLGDPHYNIYNGFYNAGYDLGGGIELYSFGNYSERTAQHYENYRTPNKISGTTSGGTQYYPLPLGFDPQEQIKEHDYSFTAGIKGANYGWNWDLSSTYGSDIDDIYVIDSANAQLFPVIAASSATPIQPQRTFYNGDFKTTQFTNTLDLDRSFNVGLASPLNVAFGGELRRETYSIGAGDPSSYYGAGAQSFDGYTPLDAGDHSRKVYAGYVDLAVDPIKHLHIDLAGRYEHYNDFGATTVGKLTGRYDFTPSFALRGTISTGFRAPTLAEEYYSGTNVSPYSAEVQLPANSAAAAYAGFAPLKPEKSDNYSLGFVWKPLPKLQVTADFYEIKIKDRILVSGFIYGSQLGFTGVNQTACPSAASYPTNTNGCVSQQVLNSIAVRGVTLDSGLSYAGIAVFANAANTKTDGAEVTANYASEIVDWSLGFNYNKTDATLVKNLPTLDQNAAFGQINFLDKNALSALTTATPREKAILGAIWTWHKWSVNLRETIYGPASQWSGNNAVYQKIGTSAITDLEVSYKLTPAIRLDAGADNIFDKKPPVQAGIAGGGRVYNAPYGFTPYNPNGGYYYGRVTFTF
jgi:iron complex outermembrane receptor protein